VASAIVVAVPVPTVIVAAAILDVAANIVADQPAIVVSDVAGRTAGQFDGRAAHIAARVTTVGIEPTLIHVRAAAAVGETAAWRDALGLVLRWCIFPTVAVQERFAIASLVAAIPVLSVVAANVILSITVPAASGVLTWLFDNWRRWNGRGPTATNVDTATVPTPVIATVSTASVAVASSIPSTAALTSTVPTSTILGRLYARAIVPVLHLGR
jgi:hypothetical protein